MALVLGTNSGFVSVAPTVDPAGASEFTIDGSSTVTKHTSPAGAVKITEIGWYRAAGTDTANWEVALYSDSAGVADARLFVDATNSSAAGGWLTVAVDWTISPSTDYWLGLQMDAHVGSSTVDIATSLGAGRDALGTQTALNDPYGGGAVFDADGMVAIYALVAFAPVADFSGTPLSGAAPLTVQFTDASTNTPTSWSWDFGDGGTSTDQNPSHEYAAAGTYTVVLTATNAAGSDVETKVAYITVTAAVVVQRFVGAGVDVPTWREAVQTKFEELNAELKADVKQEKKLVKQIRAAKKKLETAKNPDGILANLHLLEQKKQGLERQIKDLRIQIEWVNLQFDDEEDEEILLLH
jgi:hypothetical protein